MKMITNYIKTKIDNTQKNNKCKLCNNRDETVNCMQMKLTGIKGIQE